MDRRTLFRTTIPPLIAAAFGLGAVLWPAGVRANETQFSMVTRAIEELSAAVFSAAPDKIVEYWAGGDTAQPARDKVEHREGAGDKELVFRSIPRLGGNRFVEVWLPGEKGARLAFYAERKTDKGKPSLHAMFKFANGPVLNLEHDGFQPRFLRGTREIRPHEVAKIVERHDFVPAKNLPASGRRFLRAVRKANNPLLKL
jgi:hypothetical protein